MISRAVKRVFGVNDGPDCLGDDCFYLFAAVVGAPALFPVTLIVSRTYPGRGSQILFRGKISFMLDMAMALPWDSYQSASSQQFPVYFAQHNGKLAIAICQYPNDPVFL